MQLTSPGIVPYMKSTRRLLTRGPLLESRILLLSSVFRMFSFRVSYYKITTQINLRFFTCLRLQEGELIWTQHSTYQGDFNTQRYLQEHFPISIHARKEPLQVSVRLIGVVSRMSKNLLHFR